MATKYTIKALQIYTNVFQNNLEPITFHWNCKKKVFQSITSRRKLSVWTLNMCLISLLGVGGCFLLIGKMHLKYYDLNQLPLLVTILVFGFLVLGTFLVIVFFASLAFGADFAFAWNARELPDEVKKDLKDVNPAKYDFPGLGLLVLSVAFPVYIVPLYFVGGTYMKLDSFYWIMKSTPWIWNSPLCYALANLVIRLPMMVVCLVEAARMVLLIIILFVSGVRKLHEALDGLLLATEKRKHLPFQSHFFLKSYTNLRLFIILCKFQEVVTLFLMCVGFCMAVACNFVCVRGYSEVPAFLFFSAPVGSGLTCTLIQVLVPRAVYFYDKTTTLLQQWKQTCASRNHYLSVRLRSLPPLKLYVGTGEYKLFYFKQATRITFYDTILSYTINALLTN